MLTLYDTNENPMFPLDVLAGTFFITHNYDGLDLLSFDIETGSEYYKYIANEVRVKTDDNRYVIRSIDEHDKQSTIDCTLDVDDWKADFYKEYKLTEVFLAEVLSAIKPPGWTFSGAGIKATRHSIELENVTAFDILMKAAVTYDVVFNFDAINKQIKVIVPSSYSPTGEYLTDELNLKKLSFKGISTDLVTRIYPYGKDGLTIADVNGGKEYVQNTSYSKKIMSVAWKDERYTVAENLKAAAEKKLETAAFPECSYECEIDDLAKTNKDFSFLTFWLYKVVTLIDRRRKTRINHQIVEYKEYPLAPENNVVTLSTTAPRIENSIKNLQNEILEQAENSNNYMENAIKHNNDMILGNNGGCFKWKINKFGYPEEEYLMDTDDINSAKNIWIRNVKGIGISNNGRNGPFGSAWLIDGSFCADYINFGKLKGSLLEVGSVKAEALSVAYKTTVSQEISDTAQSKVDAFKNGEFAKLSQDFTVANGKLSSNIELSKSNEIKWSNLSQSYDNISLEVGNKLNISEFSTKLSVSSDAVQIAWNGISQNIKFEGSWFYGGEMNIYDGAASPSKLISFGSSGMKLYRDNYTVGMIGTNRVGSDTSKKGLDFDLNYDGAYMAWAVQETSGSRTFTAKFIYAKQAFDGLSANQLHAGCDINMHGYKLLNPSFQDGGITGTINFVKVIGVSNDGTLSGWVADCSMEFKNGLLVSAGW